MRLDLRGQSRNGLCVLLPSRALARDFRLHLQELSLLLRVIGTRLLELVLLLQRSSARTRQVLAQRALFADRLGALAILFSLQTRKLSLQLSGVIFERLEMPLAHSQLRVARGQLLLQLLFHLFDERGSVGA